MIAFVWKRLPGPRSVRFLTMLTALAVIAVLLWYGVFPLISERVPIGNPTLE